MEISLTASDIRRLKAEGKLAAILCIEGGHSIEDDLGVRYMTLTWNNTNLWADGILDSPKHDGLNELGRKIIQEMNRIGIIVDISHVAVKTFWDTLEVTTKPVMASHSGALSICKHPRNLNDVQLRSVADDNGVVCATFVTSFVSEQLRTQLELLDLATPTLNTTTGPVRDDVLQELKMPSYTEVVDHVDHMVQITSIDHVGLGSDFGVISTTPRNLEACSKFPVITEELLRRRYSDEDVRKILGENVLRVMEDTIGA